MPDTGELRTYDGAFQLDDFVALTAPREYRNLRTGGAWDTTMINHSFPPIVLLDANGAPQKVNGKIVKITPSSWLNQNRRVDQQIWAPGEPQLVEGRIVRKSGWRKRDKARCLNVYEAPEIVPSDAAQATPWVEHVHKVYPDDASHIVKWLAFKVQNPGIKINHALVLGGSQGVGKDTLLEPIIAAIGEQNFHNISPTHLTSAFNSFVMSVILQIDEARDLGENTKVNRFTFYDHLKIYAAAPPKVLPCNEKHVRMTYVLNVLGLVITTNYRFDGLYLPANDRRHYVAWSELITKDFEHDYFDKLHRWYDSGGNGHVAAYLHSLDLSDFNPKAPPPRTKAMLGIIDASTAPENSELADAIDQLNEERKDGLTLCTLRMIAGTTKGAAMEWLLDRKFRRAVPHRMADVGYIGVRNPDAKDGLWKIKGARQVIYAPTGMAPQEQEEGARELVLALTETEGQS
jgi:Family of unknown function (DUF5906)